MASKNDDLLNNVVMGYGSEDCIEKLSSLELERTIDRMTQTLYRRNRRFTPLYPWCFVRVCEREHQREGIWLPIGQNKTVHEGIVLATWKTKFHDRDDSMCSESELSLGDHVLFQHFAGVPIEGYDRDRYRVVRECDWDPGNQGGIFATVQYGGLRATERMTQILKRKGLYDEAAQAAVKSIEDQFMLVPRDAHSVTLSGR